MDVRPPEYALRFLRWFCRADYLEEIEGDLIELFEQQSEQHPTRAKWNFSWQVLRHFRPDFLRSFKLFNMFRPDLIRHNLLVSYRSFLHNKNTFFINLTGLSTGLACVFLIFLWVNDELHVDKFFEHDKQLFQVLQSVQGPNGIETIEATPGPLARTLKEEMPEIQYATSVIPATFNVGQGVVGVEDIRFKAAGKYASRDFFQVFSYRLLQGERSEVLSEKNGVVISEALALRLFQGSENAIGRTIDWQANGIAGPCMISGVFADPPPNATDRFDLVLNYQWYLDHFPEAGWGDSSPRSFVLLKHGTRSDGLQGKIKNFIHTKDDHSNAVLTLQRYSDRYLYDHFENGEVAGGRIEYVRLFMVIAFFILAIACINFINLTTARSVLRAEEVAVRKVLGSQRRQLIAQFFTESIMYVGTSLVLALVLTRAVLPLFNDFADKQLTLQILLQPILLTSVLGFAALTTFITGIIPATVLSSFTPARILKDKIASLKGRNWLREGLVVMQFAISAALIIGSEATGPSAAARAHSQAVAIPMHGHTESLNAAMAGAVILFEAARQRRVRKSRLR